MTQAVCTVCGARKIGAWTPCPQCGFQPQTVFELVVSLAFSENGGYQSQLSVLPAFVQQQIRALETGDGEFSFDVNLIPLIEDGLRNPGFRDIITLRRTAKDGILSKQLNMHEIGPDGYAAHVLKRGRDVDAAVFDAIRATGDGDLYVIVTYDSGERQQQSVPKDRWYAARDLMLLVERGLDQSRSKLQRVYEEFCEDFIQSYLEHGTIVGR